MERGRARSRRLREVRGDPRGCQVSHPRARRTARGTHLPGLAGAGSAHGRARRDVTARAALTRAVQQLLRETHRPPRGRRVHLGAALIAHGHPTAPIQTPRQRAFESDEKRSSFLDDYRFALLLVVVAAIDARATEMTKYEGVRVACFARLRVSFSALDYVLYARHPIPSFRQSYHLRGTVSSRRSFAQPLRDVSPRDVVPRVVQRS